MTTETAGPKTRRDAATPREQGASTRPAPPLAERASPDRDAPPSATPKRRHLHPRTRKRLLWGAAGVVLALLLIYAFSPTPLEVEAATVANGPLQTTVDAEGVTRVHERYVIAVPISGRLERIALREGDAVRAGTVVARITPLPLDPQAIVQARAHLSSAQALHREAETRVQQTRESLEQTRRSTERVRAVAEAGAFSQDFRERAELQLAAAEREHEAAQARAQAAASEVAAARAVLLEVDPERSRGRAVAVVRSPSAGQVLRLQDASERVIAAGTPLLEVGDPGGLEVVVDVLSTEAVKIQPGAPMRLVEWGGEGVLEGRVRRVEPSGFTKVSALGVEEQRVNVIGELSAAPPSLGDGYRVEARIVTWEAAEVLKVPVSALFRVGEEWSVFVVEDGRARLSPVRLGQRGTAEAEVMAGLTAGQEVILYPSDRIAEGARVRPR